MLAAVAAAMVAIVFGRDPQTERIVDVGPAPERLPTLTSSQAADVLLAHASNRHARVEFVILSSPERVVCVMLTRDADRLSRVAEGATLDLSRFGWTCGVRSVNPGQGGTGRLELIAARKRSGRT